MGGKSWTEKEIEYIKENAGEITPEEIANKLNRTRKAILHKIESLGLEARSKMKIGDQNNRLTLRETWTEYKYGQNITFGKFECECGNFTEIKVASVKSGKTKSCGCLLVEKARERTIERNTTHGMTNHPLYKIWVGMIARCTYPSQSQYKDYGGREIKVCEEWKNDFQIFADWAISNGWKSGLTIDRKDNSKGYSSENCKISTYKEQNNNKRSNVLVTAFNETKTLMEWSEDNRCEPDYRALRDRIQKLGWEAEKAITTPARDIDRSVPAPYTGVSYIKQSGKWKSYVTQNGKRITIGHFVTAEEANKARQKFLDNQNKEKPLP